jgi:hypothetical protein
MASDDSEARLLLRLFLLALDGARPAGTLEWASSAAPVVTQVAVGAGHWSRGRRQRALAAWASAAGLGLVVWGLGTEAPTRAEAEKNAKQHRDRLRELGSRRLGPGVPAAEGTQTAASQRFLSVLAALTSCSQIVFGVRAGLRRPRRLTVYAVVSEAPLTVLCGLRAARAAQRRKPRIAAGSALVAAGSVARLRAAAAEPLQRGA